MELDCDRCNKKVLFEVPLQKDTTFYIDRGIRNIESIFLCVTKNKWTQNQKIKLSNGEFKVGRHRSDLKNSLSILTEDKQMSRFHFVLTMNEEKEVTIKDNKSTNGLFINGIEIKPEFEVYINENDSILIGRTTMELSVTN